MLLGKLVGSQFASAAGKRFFRLRKTGGVLVVEYREIIESN